MITKYSQSAQRARAGCHQKTDVVNSCQFVVEHDTKRRDATDLADVEARRRNYHWLDARPTASEYNFLGF